MKKYTTPEIEIIKFQIQEAIADEVGAGPSGNLGVGEGDDDFIGGRG